MRKILLFLIFDLILLANVFSQTIITIAGNGTGGFSGDGGQATAAEIKGPTGVSVDAIGNVYIADVSNSRVRVVSPAGIVTTFAGNGISFGYAGDGGPATAAEIPSPWAVASDTSSGNVYIGDVYNNIVRKVNNKDTIRRFAGIGSPFGFSGDGGQATNAEISYPTGLTVDGMGNVYIADQFNNRVRKVNTLGIISTIAGNDNITGYSGDGGQATNAEINVPTSVAVDKYGSIYFTDCNNERVRRINTAGIISTIAGNGIAGYSGDGGQATAAELNGPIYVEPDTYGNIFIADVTNNRIRKITASGIISTIAGNGIAGYSGDGGVATAAELNGPHGIAVDNFGNLYIADASNYRIRKVIAPLGINELSTNANEIKLFPNPNNGVFSIVIANEAKQSQCELEIYNLLGELVRREELRDKNTNINLSNCANGVYLYRLITETGNLAGEGKFVIEK